ncbi:MAG: hypothetical protein ABGX16_18470 [Pirellulales bacterium]
MNWLAGIFEASGMEGLGVSAKSRNFRLTYAATIKHLPPGRTVRVWLPSPTENSFQQINPISSSFPARTQLSVEPKYGNQIQYFETIIPSTGKITFESTYAIVRHEVARSNHNENPQNRVAFTTGRDINLVPKQAGQPLNFFIYPHAEVDQQPVHAEHIDWKVSFADL